MSGMDRLQLQTTLEEALGSTNVYFQPPSNAQMQYPAIVYNLDRVDTRFAGDKPYSHEKRYQVTVIDRNPDSVIPDQVAALPKSAFNRFFAVSGLNHYIFTLYA